MLTSEKILELYGNERIRNIVRLRPDGECFQCGKVKKELMEDPDNPTKIYEEMYIYCNDCYEEIQQKYKQEGKFTY